MKFFHLFILETIAERKISQVEFARTVGFSESSISLYISRNRTPSHDDLLRLIKKLYEDEEDQKQALLRCYFGR